MNISFDLTQFKAGIDEKRSQIHAATRPAAQAGAQVIYDHARLNAPTSKKEHYFHGTSFKKYGTKYLFQAGTLKNSIYQAFSEDNSREGLSTYHVSWNYTKCPYGFMVEFGTSKAPAHSFIGKAMREGGAAAAEAMKARFIEDMAIV